MAGTSSKTSTKAKKEPRGLRNNNPLNIRKGSSWQGERRPQKDPTFEEFISMEYGIRAAFKLMINHITGFAGTRKRMNTLTLLISVWAPPTENATNKYIDFVATSAGILPSMIIDYTNEALMCKIARAMAYVECGRWLDESLFHSAWALK